MLIIVVLSGIFNHGKASLSTLKEFGQSMLLNDKKPMHRTGKGIPTLSAFTCISLLSF